MSRHDGVSCDSCLKGNFRGRRYKCLICYDYDLCAACYDAGATTTRHTTEHPMQCILTRAEFDLYYGGEAISVDVPQSFACPFCTRKGFTEQTLQDHVAADHADSSFEVVCPVCAALPGGDPNQVTDDFAAHLSLEHRSPRDLISFADEPSGSRPIRRIPHPGRGVTGTRARRTNMHFSASGALASLSPSRDSMDPIAELLSQLSGVRRSNAAQSNTTSQLQQLQLQLQLERQQAQAARQQLERLPRRQVQNAGASGAAAAAADAAAAAAAQSNTSSSTSSSQFLLSRCEDSGSSESALEAVEVGRCERSLFVQELLINTLTEQLTVSERSDPVVREQRGELQAEPRASTARGSAVTNTSHTRLVKKPVGPSSSKVSARITPSRETVAPCTGAVSTTSNHGVPVGGRASAPALSLPINRFNSGTGTVREVVTSALTSVNRAPLRSSSPSSRRKIQRHVDSRNHPNDPPPH